MSEQPARADTLTGRQPLAAAHPRVLGRQLGGSALRMHPIALGCGTFGWSVDERGSSAILDRFVALGGNVIDASCAHPDGRSEAVVGAWLSRRQVRQRVLLGTTIGTHHDFSEEPARVIARAVDTALGRLRTDYLDLLAVRLGPGSCEELLVAIDDLVRAGKVRQVAACTPTADQLVEARVLAGQLGVIPLVAVKARYNLLQRAGFEAGLARMVALQDSGFLAKHPLAGGLLSGQHRSRHELDRLARTASVAAVSPRRRSAILGALSRVGDELSVSVSHVALAWLLSRGNVSAAVVSVRTLEQLDDVVGSAGTRLSRHQVAELDRVSR